MNDLQAFIIFGAQQIIVNNGSDNTNSNNIKQAFLLKSFNESTSNIWATMFLLICAAFIFGKVPNTAVSVLVDNSQGITDFHFAFDFERMSMAMIAWLISTRIFIELVNPNITIVYQCTETVCSVVIICCKNYIEMINSINSSNKCISIPWTKLVSEKYVLKFECISAPGNYCSPENILNNARICDILYVRLTLL